MSDEVKKITIQLRAPRGRDAGKIAVGHYCVVEGYVVMTDENGKPTGDGTRLLNKDGDARLIACAMLRSSRRYGNSRPAGFGFGDKLIYQKVRY
jgi:hypothetical protein